MKMKLAQRLVVRYYIAQLKALALVSPKKAAAKAFELFCTPVRGKKTKNIPAVFAKAQPIAFSSETLTIRGFQWKPEQSNGKKVLILHGFSSNAYKFDKYINPLLKEGFQVILFDAPAHGSSDGKLINAYIYGKAILEAEKLYGPFYALIGHSLGGLAASLVFEALPDNEHRKLVLIAPATETTTTLADYFRMIPVDEKVKAAFMQLITDISGKDVLYYSVSRVTRNISSPVLWVHDRADTVCPFKDVAPLVEENLPHIQFLITEQLGHSRIYKDATVIKKVIDFIAGNN